MYIYAAYINTASKRQVTAKSINTKDKTVAKSASLGKCCFKKDNKSFNF